MELDLPRGAAGRVAVIVDRYPCLSESFVRRDLASLESSGLTLALVTCSPARRCDTWLPSELRATIFRPEHSMRAASLPRRVHLGASTLQNLKCALPLVLPRPYGVAAVTRAAWTAAAIQPLLEKWKPDWVHAYFLGIPAAAAFLLADRLRVPLSISAHARDIFVPVVRLASVCAHARFVATCSEHARASLRECLPAAMADRVLHFPHNVACGSVIEEQEAREGAPLRLLSICRLVPKKGIDVVLQALVLLPPEVRYRYRIVGGGPELLRLRALALDLGLQCVEFVGPIPPSAVPAELAQTDIFVLGARTAPDGDRDGIPNAMLEAMAAGIPVVVSDGGGVSEVVRNRRTGWLPSPNNPRAFAEALREAASDPMLRRSMALNAHIEVRRRFSAEQRPNLFAIKLTREIALSLEVKASYETGMQGSRKC